MSVHRGVFLLIRSWQRVLYGDFSPHEQKDLYAILISNYSYINTKRKFTHKQTLYILKLQTKIIITKNITFTQR